MTSDGCFNIHFKDPQISNLDPPQGAADIESPATLHGRRSGAAACAGWVRCPLCCSLRCFNRGEGLKLNGRELLEVDL